MAQPTVENIQAIVESSLVMGKFSCDETMSKMFLHYLVTVVGWIGWWFFKCQRKGANIALRNTQVIQLVLFADGKQHAEVHAVNRTVGVFWFTIGPHTRTKFYFQRKLHLNKL